MRAENSVTLFLLPTYSPELNPCERIFGMVKTHLRNKRRESQFLDEIAVALSLVDFENVTRFYSHCIQIEKIDSW